MKHNRAYIVWNIVITLHSLQRQRCCAGEDTLLAASCHISNILSQFNHQNLGLTMWAFAKIGWRPDAALLARVCQHAVLTLRTINSQNLANLLWALATLDFIPTAALLEV